MNTFDKLCDILELATAVIVSDDENEILCYPSYSNDEEDFFLELSTMGGEYHWGFEKEDNLNPEFLRTEIVLKDNKGFEVKITPLFTKNLSEIS